MHTTPFQSACQELLAAKESFRAGQLGSLDHSRAREKHLAIALRELAKEYGARLQEPLHIDSRGDFSLIALRDGWTNALMGTAPFGGFVELLNQHNPRTGTAPGRLCEDNGWCYLNHFDAERLVLGAFERQMQAEENEWRERAR